MSDNETESVRLIQTADDLRRRRMFPDYFMTGMFMLLLLLSYEAISFVASLILLVPEYYEKYLNDAMFYNVVDIVFEVGFIGIPVLVMLILYKGNRKELLRFNKISFKEIAIIVPIGILTFAANLFLTDANCLFAELFVNIDVPETPAVTNTAEAIMLMVMLVIVAPVLEEIMTRGIMMRGFEGVSKWFAIIITGTFFGMFHMSYYTLIPKILAGILFCYAVYITDSIITGMLLHAINNGITGLITVFSDLSGAGAEAEVEAAKELTVFEQIYQIAFFFIIGACFAAMIAGLLVALKKVASVRNEQGKLVCAGRIREKFENEQRIRWYKFIPIALVFAYFTLTMLAEIAMSVK